MASNGDQLKSDHEQMIDISVNRLDSNERAKRTIDNLPPELMPLIFEHLDLFYLPNCRLVSKLWKFYIDRVKITELIVKDRNKYPYQLWVFDMKSQNLRNSIKRMDLLHRFPFELTNVRRLELHLIRNKHEFEMLKLFPNVQHLQIYYLWGKGAEIHTLDLPELKKLYVGLIYRCRLTINSRLEALCNNYLNLIHCVHSLEIKILYLDYRNTYEDLLIYKNVQCLSIIRPSVLGDLVSNELISKTFKNLKIIKCYSFWSPILSDWKDAIDRLTVLRLEWGKEESLKIYVNDTKLIGIKGFEEYGIQEYSP